ncbi:hypothetical protein CBF90_02035 [Microbacterium sp. AISO3]|uniref:hypothetical protein n=1 Tax=Microbacterium sp. AISO3 TaxID=2002831 RepID=UPI000B4D1BE6|nr:hypothetical protein [Microbacterium sp. AISO3]OWP20318.1 hypothetical protein CBF90_17210 [Microbacterium sp. AISO3]OWP23529.1 hypothetical protein CBF90_02035 [Microbacterium sp. AISO3]
MDKWILRGRLISTGAPVEMVIERSYIVSMTPPDLLQPVPNYLQGFAKLGPDDTLGRVNMISEYRPLEVTYDEAIESNGLLVTGDLYPYFLGGGNGGYDVLFANIEITEFVRA